MKPFNLERALAGDPVITRRGDRVIEIKSLITGQLVVVFKGTSGKMQSYFYSEGGRFYLGFDSPHDLCMAPVKKKVWTAIFGNPNGTLFAKASDTLELHNSRLRLFQDFKLITIHEFEYQEE